MNHQEIYNNIISNAQLQNRIKLKFDNISYCYYEKHHILPSCLGGGNNKENLVLLTTREHFICHKLLTFIHKGNRKIACAFFRMSYDNRNRKVSSRDYAYAKELMSVTGHSTETKKLISDAIKGHKHTLEYRINKSIKYKKLQINKGDKNPMFHVDPWNKGKRNVYSEDTLIKMRKPKTEEHKAKLRKPKTEEHKAKLRKPYNKSWICNTKISILKDKNEIEDFLKNNPDFHKGRIVSEETKEKIRKSTKGRIPWNKRIKN